MLEKIFKLSENQTNIKTEISAGIVTFMTMAYIIFLQPAIMRDAGMDFGAVMVATCLASAFATLVMAFAANYPIALAPCMGENFFFVSVATGAVTGIAVGWQAALASVFISGALFLFLSLFKVREKIFESIPLSLKSAISIGIGFFIAFIGFQKSGIISASPGTMVTIGNLTAVPTILSISGLIFISVLLFLKVRGALLIGLIATAAAGIPLGIVRYHGIVEAPPSIAPVFFQLDFHSVFQISMVPVILIFLFMVLFDTIGTLIGVGQQAQLMTEGKLPRAGRALLADAFGTTAGSILGASTVSSYIESAAGVSQGGRTGLSNVITAILFLLAVFFAPLVRMIGEGYEISPGLFLSPVTAPVLIIVGYFMAKGAANIPWDDPSEAIPAFITILGIPLTYNIGDGIAFGFISYAFLKILSGKGRKVSVIIYIMAVLLIGLFALRAH
jgi:AGZA family xanthine/uracil permease-like MFS transporter